MSFFLGSKTYYKHDFRKQFSLNLDFLICELDRGSNILARKIGTNERICYILNKRRLAYSE